MVAELRVALASNLQEAEVLRARLQELLAASTAMEGEGWEVEQEGEEVVQLGGSPVTRPLEVSTQEFLSTSSSSMVEEEEGGTRKSKVACPFCGAEVAYILSHIRRRHPEPGQAATVQRVAATLPLVRAGARPPATLPLAREGARCRKAGGRRGDFLYY